ncbi:MAG: hypothetical protein QGG54_14045 [Gammaproteobacteria bacterium]|jgi:hypothetical protein|nr:hypothetical protein [Gammaproteobacteria bacterium]MDP6651618.1 hypothetical protein [Gammaproteobacteria bacterium]|tara:strand:+ start:649 stop:858 length:210 start_codon:yes stop_codon:yes gene_type:complete
MSLQGAVNTLVSGVKETARDVTGLGAAAGNGLADGMDIAAGVACKGLSMPGAVVRRLTHTAEGFVNEIL